MKILILQLKRIGDLILTTPVIRALREELPGCEVFLAMDSACEGLQPAIDADGFFVFRKGGLNAAFWRDLFQLRCDVCLDLTGNDRSAMAAFLSRGRQRITFNKYAKKFPHSLAYTVSLTSSMKGRHVTDHYLDAVQPLGIKRQGVPLSLRSTDAVREQAHALLAAHGITGKYAVIHAGTARPEKYWLADRWAEVAKHLTQRGIPVVLTGDGSENEKQHLAAIKEKSSGPLLDLSGSMPLAGLVAVIAEAQIFCGVDTAAMHMADALGVPTVALFGPTNPMQWGPRGVRSRIVYAGPPDVTGDHHLPMDTVTVKDVFSSIDGLLGIS